MFTGIIQDIGTVADISRDGDWKLTISTQTMDLDQTPIGASIACSGVCLTVVDKGDHFFGVQVSEETLSRTTVRHWVPGTRLNLEHALRFGDEIGGHLVTGHVDAKALVLSREKQGDSVRFGFEIPPALARYVAAKGSAVIDGVSLTVNEVDDARVAVNIIPHTQIATTLGEIRVGSEVNFEVDMIARYLDRLLKRP